MTEAEFDKLISDSLKRYADTAPEEAYEPHIFSASFEKRMERLLYQLRPELHRKLLPRRWWFVLVAVLLAMLACSLTAYSSKTNSIHFFADDLSDYQMLGEMDEDIPEQMDLIYGLEYLQKHYTQGVDISNGEQYTRFFHDAESGRFLEFSSYSRRMFRYHINTEQMTAEPLTLHEKEVIYYKGQGGMQYIIWSMDASVLVVRSDFERDELIAAVDSIELYETPLQ